MFLHQVMATCFGRTFNHHQALKKSVQVPQLCTLWDPIHHSFSSIQPLGWF